MSHANISQKNIPMKIYSNTILSNVNLLSIDNYSKLQTYLKRTSLIVNDADIGEKLRKFIKNKLDVNVDLNNNTMENQIKLDYNKDEDSYKFLYFIKDKNYNKQIYPFKNSLLSASEAEDLFISIDPGNLHELYKENSEQIKNFILYQSLLSNFMINQKSNITQKKNITFQFGFNSYPPSIEMSDKTFLNFIVFYINSSFLYFSYFFQILLFSEKNEIKVMLNELGISKTTNFLSWILIYLILNSFIFIKSYILLSFILKISHIFFAFYLFLFLIVSFFVPYIISCFTTERKFLFIIKIPYFIFNILFFVDIIPIFKYILSIFPIINLFYSINAIIKYQTLNKPFINIMTINVDGTCLLINMIILIIEIIILLLIVIVLLKKEELGLSFIDFIKYIFTKKRPNILVKNKFIIDDNNNKNNVNNISVKHEELSHINKGLKQENNCLKIQNIYKEYDDVKAVDHFNCELFKDEIFVLLGHNGAGKTTLIKIISGAEDPTNGDILLNNDSLIINRNLLYQNLGICFQEDIFFPYLTINEHLKFIMEIKKDKINQDQVDNLLKDLDLIEQKDQVCLTLSGGQKRKLCIALALIGNSKIVLLDEPTSGLDVFCRRKLWDFLKGYKKDKIIILTTHSLEEAEYLGDRIGIMNCGKFVCSGIKLLY